MVFKYNTIQLKDLILLIKFFLNLLLFLFKKEYKKHNNIKKKVFAFSFMLSTIKVSDKTFNE